MTMAPQLQPLARSESKTKFFHRLGLSSEKSCDNHLYELMKVGQKICESVKESC